MRAQGRSAAGTAVQQRGKSSLRSARDHAPGFPETCIITEDGRDGHWFQMAGEIIGLGSAVNDRHSCDAIALEDAKVYVMPFDKIETESHGKSRRCSCITQDHEAGRSSVKTGVMLLLGSMRAEERLAAFLLENLVQRLHARGFSQSGAHPAPLTHAKRWRLHRAQAGTVSRAASRSSWTLASSRGDGMCASSTSMRSKQLVNNQTACD